jgi:hypothetical protein
MYHSTRLECSVEKGEHKFFVRPLRGIGGVVVFDSLKDELAILKETL